MSLFTQSTDANKSPRNLSKSCKRDVVFLDRLKSNSKVSGIRKCPVGQRVRAVTDLYSPFVNSPNLSLRGGTNRHATDLSLENQSGVLCNQHRSTAAIVLKEPSPEGNSSTLHHKSNAVSLDKDSSISNHSKMIDNQPRPRAATVLNESIADAGCSTLQHENNNIIIEQDATNHINSPSPDTVKKSSESFGELVTTRQSLKRNENTNSIRENIATGVCVRPAACKDILQCKYDDVDVISTNEGCEHEGSECIDYSTLNGCTENYETQKMAYHRQGYHGTAQKHSCPYENILAQGMSIKSGIGCKKYSNPTISDTKRNGQSLSENSSIVHNSSEELHFDNENCELLENETDLQLKESSDMPSIDKRGNSKMQKENSGSKNQSLPSKLLSSIRKQICNVSNSKVSDFPNQNLEVGMQERSKNGRNTVRTITASDNDIDATDQHFRTCTPMSAPSCRKFNDFTEHPEVPTPHSSPIPRKGLNLKTDEEATNYACKQTKNTWKSKIEKWLLRQQYKPLHLRGQMKYIEAWNMVLFIGTPL